MPEVVTSSGIDFHTSDTIMWLDVLPASMVILGGGCVAAEFAHVFSSLGVEIHIVTVASTLLEMPRRRNLEAFHGQGGEPVECPPRVSPSPRSPPVSGGVTLDLEDGTRVVGRTAIGGDGSATQYRRSRSWSSRIALRDDGHIVVDEFGRAAPGVWALGDVSSPFELKHVANAEARTVCYNLSHPEDPRPLPHDWVPSAVFSDPQIASVGARSQDLEGRQYVEATQEYSDTAYGWAAPGS